MSFTHPHDPYVARRRFWDLYEESPALEPEVPPFAFEDHDPQSRRILDSCDFRAFDITAEQVRRARQGYFATISYIDEKIGEILDALERARAWPTTPRSSSARTTATCLASGACGSR